MQNQAEAFASHTSKPARVLVLGNPNAGKTSVFNALTGAQARVANYPGVTVSRYSRVVTLPSGRAAEIIDTPGTYSLSALSPEEQIAVAEVFGEPTPDLMICVVDASSLSRNLYLCLQLLETGVPLVVALTMMDTLSEDTYAVDAQKLSATLGVPVVIVRAPKNQGKTELLAAVDHALAQHAAAPIPKVVYPASVEEAAKEIAAAVEAHRPGIKPNLARAEALWSLLTVDATNTDRVAAPAIRDAALTHQKEFAANGDDFERATIEARYRWIEQVTSDASRSAASTLPTRDRVDRVLLHPVGGFLVFAVVMLLLFESLFTWSGPMMDGIDWLASNAQLLVRNWMPPGVFRDLVTEGIIAGVGNVLVFAPQIFLLFLFVGFLEDCGYLARVAFVIDRLMHGVGLHGKAFVPLLSGFACAVPAVMSTRTIEQPRDRLATMLALPLMSCSARLPVYILITGTVFAGAARVGGVFTPGTLALLAMYTLSVVATLTAAAILRRTVLRGGPRSTFILELPSYRWPSVRNLWLHAWRGLLSFLTGAGTVIVALTILLWALLSFPKSEAITQRYATQRTEVQSAPQNAATELELARIDASEASEQLRYSAGGRLGKVIEPVFAPLGFDWRISIGIIASFAAREVFVSTLGVVFGIAEGDATSVPLRKELSLATWPDGAALITPLSGISLMVFFVLACQCMSTIAAVKRESGSWRWPLFMFAYMSLLAYGSSLAVYQIGHALGLG